MSSSITIEQLRSIILTQNPPQKSGLTDLQSWAFLNGIINGVTALSTSTSEERGTAFSNAFYDIKPKEELTRDKYLYYDPTPKRI